MYPFPTDSEIFYNVSEHNPMWTYAKDSDQEEDHSDMEMKMLVREDTQEVLGYHKKDYTTVQNRDLFQHIEREMINNFDLLELEHVTVHDHISKGGKSAAREYRFPKTESLITNNGHKTDIQLRAIGWNCFDGSAKCKIIFGDIDMFCMNGMVLGEKDIIAKKRTKNFNLNDFTSLEKSFENFKSKIDLYREWAQTRVNIADVEEFFSSSFKNGKKKTDGTYSNLEKFLNQFKEECSVRGQNVWSVVSAMTTYSSHTDQWTLNKQSKDNEFGVLYDRQKQVQKIMNSQAFRDLAKVAA
jgi:hypothetical protein